MDESKQVLTQYLQEAHATETSLVRVLQSQIAMAPRGSYRSRLEGHLEETRNHALSLEAHIGDLGHGGPSLQGLFAFAESAAGQLLVLGKAPFDLLRGSGGEEKVLKSAKDACAAEALEIATYTALERLARELGDNVTAELAASIRGEEETMLEFLLRELPRLTTAVVRARVQGEPSYDIADTGAADAVREVGAAAKRAAGKAEGRARSAVLGDEPWAGYDEHTVEEIRQRLADADEDRLREVRSYERAHKNRTGVLSLTEREPAHT